MLGIVGVVHHCLTLAAELTIIVLFIGLDNLILRAHVADVSSDRIAMKSNFSILPATWLDNDDHIDIPYLYLIGEFKRNHRAGGVAKYHNNNGSTHVITPQIDIITKQNQSLFVLILM
ncbi:hypothetical protein PV328_008349 [Microctonus aethiopoides]|uniref:Uncharacterized protein n=1 Tax=Microctonus aethiopoides TaxID=144406 RepID=A0AA39FJC4_9HYME|nr:hypothetical protein PV328_008349 [Microctonus aethiopoides]